MLLTLTTTHKPATDLGYLLHKNPDRLHSFNLSFGRAHVFFPEASVSRCTAALLVEIDPVKLVRRGRNSLRKYDYVNDRPYVASSFMSVAISQVLGSALGGTSRERPKLAGTLIPLEAHLYVVRCRGGEPFLRQVFEAIGYVVTVERESIRDSRVEYFSVSLQRTCRLQELLEHLYVLIPVLDDEKHYWVGTDEVEKLLRRAGDWLARHPFKEQIVDRYLRHRAPLRRQALERLLEVDDETDEEESADGPSKEESLEEALSLNDQRLQAVARTLKETGARRIVDLGCGEGKLISVLLKDSRVQEIAGLEVSSRLLERARQHLHVDRLPPRQASRLKLFQGSLIYRDRRLEGYDAAALVEVIEHLDPSRLWAFERVLFEYARPRCVVMTTPNAEYNVRFPNLSSGQFRHPDHRFEWTRAQFEAWCSDTARRHGYAVAFQAIGALDETVGSPTQMAVFTR